MSEIEGKIVDEPTMGDHKTLIYEEAGADQPIKSE